MSTLSVSVEGEKPSLGTNAKPVDRTGGRHERLGRSYMVPMARCTGRRGTKETGRVGQARCCRCDRGVRRKAARSGFWRIIDVARARPDVKTLASG